MVDIEKIKMEPLILYKKDNGKIGIFSGYNRFAVLKIMGLTELKPNLYKYSDGSYNTDILNIIDIET